MSATYKADFNLWIQRTAQLLRERRWHEIDLEHLIEEVEDFGKSDRLPNKGKWRFSKQQVYAYHYWLRQSQSQ